MQPRRRFTVDEYERLIAAGIVREGEPVELIAGEILCMVALGPRHTATLDRTVYRLNRLLPETAAIRTQAPIRLPPDAEPEPDISIVPFRADFYQTAHPAAADVLLVIEVVDSSIRFDLEVKLGLYAAAGIREAWIVDLRGVRVLVGRSPRPEGYSELIEVGMEGVLTPLAFPELALRVEEILG